ncbi:hypothetical protein KA001_03390 [Patescibacteria group bacterium]|nr:hypothetical protein [Patescibacteria group bacterium]
MLTKVFDIYKIYFLISFVVFFLLTFLFFDKSYLTVILLFLGSFLAPFLYEIDILIFVFILEPHSEYSKNIRGYILSKNYKSAFVYAHEHVVNMTSSIFRSLILVLLVYALAFLLFFGFANPFSKAVVLSYLLTSLYLQTLSFANNSWRSWYSFIEFIPKIKYAKILLILEYILFLVLIYKII